MSGKSLNGVKKGDNVSTNNLSFNEWMNLVNAEIPRNEKWADKGASYVGNPRFVSDSSDFIRFKKLQAKSKTYNNNSFGGSTPQDAISAKARVR